MKENFKSWSQITNQWLNFCLNSSTIYWENWLILMGIESTVEPISTDQLFKLSSSPIDELLKKLILLTEQSEKNPDWLLLQQLWLNLAHILLNSSSDDVPQKLKTLADKIDHIQLNNTNQEQFGVNSKNQKQKLKKLNQKLEPTDNKLLENQPKSFQENNSLDLLDLSRQVEILQQELEAKKYQIIQLNNQIAIHESKNVEKGKEFWLLKQENQQQLQTIEQLKTKIADLERIAAIGNQHLNKWRSRTFLS